MARSRSRRRYVRRRTRTVVMKRSTYENSTFIFGAALFVLGSIAGSTIFAIIGAVMVLSVILVKKGRKR